MCSDPAFRFTPVFAATPEVKSENQKDKWENNSLLIKVTR